MPTPRDLQDPGDHHLLSSLQCSSLSTRRVQLWFTQSRNTLLSSSFISKSICPLFFSNTGGLCPQAHGPMSLRAALLLSQHHLGLLARTWRGQVKQKYSSSEIFKIKKRLSRLPWYQVSQAGFCPARAAFPRSHYQCSQLQQADAYAGWLCCSKSLSAGRGINYKQARRNFCSIDGCSAGCFSLY